jgi:hypothetical protein
LGEKSKETIMSVSRGIKQGLLISAAVFGFSGSVLADAECSLKTLSGSYVFAASGYTLVAGVPQPKAIVEIINFKGDGTLVSPTGTRSVNGTILKSGGTGKYTVDTACTGTIAFDGGPSFDIFLSPGDGKVWMIQTNTDTVFPGILEGTSQSERVCSNATLQGTYGVYISGTRPAPSVAPGAPGFVGQMEEVIGVVVQVYDGKGNFTQVDNVKGTVSGITPDRPGKGIYTVNADCSGSSTVSPAPGVTIVQKALVLDGGKEIRSITITPDATNVTAIGRKL